MPPCWIYNPINMAEDGRDERGKAEDDFYLRKEEWQFHYLEVAHAACNPTSTHFSPLSILWVLINTESVPFWTISSQGSYWSHPEKSIMLVFFFTNQRPQRFMSHLLGALTWSNMWAITEYWSGSPEAWDFIDYFLVNWRWSKFLLLLGALVMPKHTWTLSSTIVYWVFLLFKKTSHVSLIVFLEGEWSVGCHQVFLTKPKVVGKTLSKLINQTLCATLVSENLSIRVIM